MKLRTKIQIKLGEAYFHGMSKVERGIYGVSLNIFDAKLIKDPYPHYNKMRERRPIHYSLALRGYWVTSFDLVQEILRDKRFGADIRHYPNRVDKIRKQIGNDTERLEAFENPSMLGLDPPDHSRIRRLAQQGFLHKFIQSLEPRIAAIVDNCLRTVENAESFDVVEVLAKPLPATVIAEMMGLPESDHIQFQQWSEDLIEATGTNEIEKLDKGNIASRQLINYFRQIIRTKRDQPGEDLISQLIGAEEQGDKLTEVELYNTCLLILVAGHETTTRLISNGLYLLLQAPGVWQELQGDRDKLNVAIEEMLRFEPPVQATQRFAREDLDFHGHHFKKGEMIFLSIAASNRDPAVNENPDVFNLNRDKVNQISFGYGIHLCIGSSLARLEAKVAFEKLLDRYPNMALVNSQPQWGNNPFFRGHEELEVKKN
jgi:cytochrome P450